jgi:hypothetical protein
LITTEGTAMAEMAQGAACLVRPGDDGALTEALAAALEGGREASEVVRRRSLGLSVAARYTWAASVAKHVEAYEVAFRAPQ